MSGGAGNEVADAPLREHLAGATVRVARHLANLDGRITDAHAGVAELRGQVESDAEQERDRCLRLGREVRWLRELLDATAADLTEERQRREWLDSDVRRLIERVEALEGAVGR